MKTLINVLSLLFLILPNIILCQIEEEKVFEEYVEDPYEKEVIITTVEGVVYIVKSEIDSLFVIEKDGITGLINKNKEILIYPDSNTYIREDKYGIRVKKNGLWGFYDKNGAELLSTTYSSIFVVNNDIIIVVDSLHKKGIYSIHNDMLIEPSFCEIRPVYNPTHLKLIISSDCKEYFLSSVNDLNSKLNIKYQYIINLYPLISRPLLKVKKNNKIGILEFNGEEIIPIEYEKLYHSKDYFIGQKDNLYGIKSYSDSTIIDFKYNEIKNGHAEDVYVVQYQWKYGVINIEGEVLIPFEYEYLHRRFYNLGGYIFSEKDKLGLISYNNEVIIKPEFLEIKAIYSNNKVPILNYFVLGENGKWAVLNRQNSQLLTRHVFDEIHIDGLPDYPVKVSIGDRIFEIDAQGKCISDCPDKEFLNQHGIERSK